MGPSVDSIASDRMKLRSLIFPLIILQIVVATQSETEEVSLTGLYSFLTNDPSWKGKKK